MATFTLAWRRAALLAAFLLAHGAAAPPRPLSPAPLGPSAGGSASIAVSHGHVYAVWVTDTTSGKRIDGAPLDATGHRTAAVTPLVAGNTAQLFPSGDGFLLSYDDERSYHRFARISADGALIQDASLPVFTNTIAVAGSQDGKRILLLRRPADTVVGVLLDEYGVVIRDNIALAPRGITPSVAGCGDGFVVMTTQSGAVQMQRLSGEGVLDSTVVPLGPASYAYSVVAATDGRSTLLFFRRYDGSFRAQLGGAMITSDGVAHNIAVAAPGALPGALLWTGDRYILVIATGPDSPALEAMRFDATGAPVDSGPVVLRAGGGTEQTIADAVLIGDDVIVTSSFSEGGPFSVFSLTLPAHGALETTGSDILSVLPERQSGPSAASSGAASLAVWKQRTGGRTKIIASLVSGGVAGRQTVLASASGYLGDPAVAYGGGIYLVAWHAADGTAAAVRIGATGDVLDPVPFVIPVPYPARFAAKPAIAWNGRRFLVVADGEPGRLAFIDVAGGMTLLAPNDDLSGEPAVAWNGQRFVVASTVPVTASGVPEILGYDIWATTLDADGAVIVPPRRIMRGRRAAIAASPSEFLVTAATQQELAGVWLDALGDPLGDDFPIAAPALHDTADAPEASAAVVWNGAAFDVAAHGFVAGDWRLAFAELRPRARVAQITRSYASRPDRDATTTAAFLSDGRLLLFSDTRADGPCGGSNCLLIAAPGDLTATSRPRSARH